MYCSGQHRDGFSRYSLYGRSKCDVLCTAARRCWPLEKLTVCKVLVRLPLLYFHTQKIPGPHVYQRAPCTFKDILHAIHCNPVSLPNIWILIPTSHMLAYDHLYSVLTSTTPSQYNEQPSQQGHLKIHSIYKNKFGWPSVIAKQNA